MELWVPLRVESPLHCFCEVENELLVRNLMFRVVCSVRIQDTDIFSQRYGSSIDDLGLVITKPLRLTIPDAPLLNSDL